MTDHTNDAHSCIARCQHCWSFYDIGRDAICPSCGDDPAVAARIRSACEPIDRAWADHLTEVGGGHRPPLAWIQEQVLSAKIYRLRSIWVHCDEADREFIDALIAECDEELDELEERRR